MMIRRTLFTLLFATVITSSVADDKSLMLEKGEDLAKQYIENLTKDINIPEQFKFDLPDNMMLSHNRFGYSGDYDLWIDPLEPMDRLRWKQDIEGGHRQLDISDDGVYFRFKKTF